jgi:hypothetical protein
MDNVDRFDKAVRLGRMALLRLRAEVLISNADMGNFSLTGDEREELERIAVAPNPNDKEFLNTFDRYYEDE